MVFCCHRSNPDKITTLVVNSSISSQEKATQYLELGYIISVSYSECRWWCQSIFVGACLSCKLRSTVSLVVEELKILSPQKVHAMFKHKITNRRLMLVKSVNHDHGLHLLSVTFFQGYTPRHLKNTFVLFMYFTYSKCSGSNCYIAVCCWINPSKTVSPKDI